MCKSDFRSTVPATIYDGDLDGIGVKVLRRCRTLSDRSTVGRNGRVQEDPRLAS